MPKATATTEGTRGCTRKTASSPPVEAAGDCKRVPCTRPIKGYRAPGGQVAFNSKLGWSDRPLEISCGQCMGCRLARARAWAVRMMHEATQHEANAFVTLTYDDEHLPADRSLRVRDWQLFAKRLRKAIGPFRFFHAGEYGETTQRPHYHAALFGVDFAEDRKRKMKSGHPVWTSQTLADAWQNGSHEIGALTWDSAMYIARYITTKINGDQAPDHYGGRKPEYTTMSRRPGLGHNWWLRHGHEIRKHDTVIVDGREIPTPKYYDKLDELLDEAAFRLRKGARIRDAQGRKEHQTPERLHAKETILKAKLALKTREPGDDL